MQEVNGSIEDWFQERQADCGLSAKIAEKPLGDGWEVDPDSDIPVRRTDGHFFELVNVAVDGANQREISEWNQPMIRQMDGITYDNVNVSGLVLLVRRKIEDLYSYLVKAKAEPGNINVEGNVLLAPTIMASFSNVLNAEKHGKKVPFWKEFGIDLSGDNNHCMTGSGVQTVVQQKDGGRFYGKANLLAMRDVDPETKLDLPISFIWATRKAIRDLQQAGLVNEHLNEVLGIFE